MRSSVISLPALRSSSGSTSSSGRFKFDGTEFEDTSVYSSNRDKIRGLVYLRKPTSDLFNDVLADMLERHMTFAEASKSSDYVLLEKSRLFRIEEGDLGSAGGRAVKPPTAIRLSLPSDRPRAVRKADGRGLGR